VSQERRYGRLEHTAEEDPVVSEDGLLLINWPELADGSGILPLDLLLAVATEPTLVDKPPRYPNAKEIAAAWRHDSQGHVQYFWRNLESRIYTFQDQAIIEYLLKTTPTSTEDGPAFGVKERPNYAGHLLFYPKRRGPVPVDQRELMIALDKTAAVLRARFQHRAPDRFTEYFDRLLMLAQVAFPPEGIENQSLEVKAASQALEEFKAEIVQTEGSQVIHEHLKELRDAATKAALMIALIAILVQTLIYYVHEHQPSWFPVLLGGITWDKGFSILHFGTLLVGSMWGIWISLSLRSTNITFEQLQNIEADLVRPWIRQIPPHLVVTL
jgi:hypothetical protein